MPKKSEPKAIKYTLAQAEADGAALKADRMKILREVAAKMNKKKKKKK